LETLEAGAFFENVCYPLKFFEVPWNSLKSLVLPVITCHFPEVPERS
jgi:hypothetical protein